MLRSVTLGLVLSVQAAACALVEPPAEADVFIVLGEVRNMTPDPVELGVRTDAGSIPGAVQPASVPAGPSSTNVTFHLPVTGEWYITANGDPWFISSPDFPDIQQGCTLRIELAPETTVGCE